MILYGFKIKKNTIYFIFCLSQNVKEFIYSILKFKGYIYTFRLFLFILLVKSFYLDKKMFKDLSDY